MITHGRRSVDDVAQLIDLSLLHMPDDTPAKAELRGTAMLVRLVAEDFDRAVDVLVDDRRQAEDIFTEALGLSNLTQADDGSTDGVMALVGEIRERLADSAPDLRVSTLSTRGDEDTRVIVRLHAAIETRADPAGIALNHRIWRFIDDYTARRRYGLQT
ncbi:hypothetical protein [Streptomyces malaysiensis]|uniref:hypothetical protein n=1 Tax=Streptomyces malaysiensis TaxID=92644 RepID=UPI002B3095A4|nr:hypothetical protein R8789_08560 [Streptomyces malaysiensis]